MLSKDFMDYRLYYFRLASGLDLLINSFSYSYDSTHILLTDCSEPMLIIPFFNEPISIPLYKEILKYLFGTRKRVTILSNEIPYH